MIQITKAEAKDTRDRATLELLEAILAELKGLREDMERWLE